jgi:hypothetical protein
MFDVDFINCITEILYKIIDIYNEQHQNQAVDPTKKETYKLKLQDTMIKDILTIYLKYSNFKKISTVICNSNKHPDVVLFYDNLIDT